MRRVSGVWHVGGGGRWDFCGKLAAPANLVSLYFFKTSLVEEDESAKPEDYLRTTVFHS